MTDNNDVNPLNKHLASVISQLSEIDRIGKEEILPEPSLSEFQVDEAKSTSSEPEKWVKSTNPEYPSVEGWYQKGDDFFFLTSEENAAKMNSDIKFKEAEEDFQRELQKALNPFSSPKKLFITLSLYILHGAFILEDLAQSISGFAHKHFPSDRDWTNREK